MHSFKGVITSKLILFTHIYVFNRYRNIPKKIDHDRILPLYDTDAPEEFQFLKDKFINQQYYTRDEHKTILQKFRKGAIKKGRASMMVPIRVARAFRRQRSSTATNTANVAKEAEATNIAREPPMSAPI